MVLLCKYATKICHLQAKWFGKGDFLLQSIIKSAQCHHACLGSCIYYCCGLLAFQFNAVKRCFVPGSDVCGLT